MYKYTIGSLPVYEFMPLEYRYALDAALSVIGNRDDILVRCGHAALMGEVRNRILSWRGDSTPGTGLWVEPQVESWMDDLSLFKKMDSGATLAIVTSQPLARFMEEWKNISGEVRGLGIRLDGLWQLCRGVSDAGFEIQSYFGIHTLETMSLNFFSRLAISLDRPALSDRLIFTARLHYLSANPLKYLSTVALIFACKTSL